MAQQTRIAIRAGLALSLSWLALACESDPSAPEVSGTEVWRLELEQTDDGSTTSPIARQRGTINLLLRLNHTTTPDAACAGRSNPNATTFVASVEVIPSRLQRPTSGSANGSWNCFGFSAEVRLDDGTRYDLASDELAFDTTQAVEPSSPMLPNRWTAGARRGHFLFAPRTRFTYDVFDSHLDVVVDNRSDDDAAITLGRIARTRSWRHHDLEYSYDEYPDLVRAGVVPGGATRRIVFPAHPAIRSAAEPATPVYYLIWVQMQVRLRPFTWGLFCYLAPERRDELVFIVHDEGEFECGDGWLGTAYFTLDPQRLFLRPGAMDTVTIELYNVESFAVESAEPSVQATVVSNVLEESGRAVAKVAIRAAADAPRQEHGVVVRVRIPPEGELVATIPVEVYELDLAVAPDTLVVARGGADSATIRLARVGLLGIDVRLDVPELPQNVFLVPPSFAPGVTRADSSRLTVRIDGNAQPGNYPLTVCAVIVVDPRESCHPTPLTLRVTAPPDLTGYDLEVLKTASRTSVASGDTVVFTIVARNLGPEAPVGPAVLDGLPAGMNYVRDDGNGAYSPLNGVWSFGFLPAGQSRTLRITVTATATATNTASIVSESARDRNAVNNSSSVTVIVQ